MTGYVLTEEARRDVLDLLNYVANDSPPAADRIEAALLDAFSALGERPGMGHFRPEITSRPVRFWPVMGRYSIVYRERPPLIEILRVAGPGRDIAALIGS